MHSKKCFGIAGAGKTTFLIGELEKLLEKYDYNDIAFCSYTKSAAHEAKDRVMAKFGCELKEIKWFSTVHSICFRLLGLSPNMVAEKSKKKFCEELHIAYMEEKEPNIEDEEGILNCGKKNTSTEGNAYFSFYDFLRNNKLKEINELNEFELKRYWAESDASDSFELTDSTINIEKFLFDWWAYKKKNNLHDFCDMLMETMKLKIDLPVKVIILDEAQDTTPLQAALLKSWIDLGKEYFLLAGDDDQNIFAFAGTDSDWFLNHKADEEIVLGVSYRVPKRILKLAEELINRNSNRKFKIMNSNKEGGEVVWLTKPSFKEIVSAQGDKKSVFVLFRTNKFENEFMEEMLREGVPFNRIRKFPIWTQKAVDLHNAIKKLASGCKINFRELYQVISETPSKPYLIRGIKKELETRASERSRLEEFGEEELLDWAFARFVVKLKDEQFLYRMLKLSEMREKMFKAVGNRLIESIPISIGTYHSSKGKEADIVVVFTDYPNKIKEIDEHERRNLYVAITRTKEKVVFVNGYFGENTIANEELQEVWRGACKDG